MSTLATTVPAACSGRRHSRKLGAVYLSLGSVLLFFVLWQVAAGLNPAITRYLAAPDQIALAARQMISTGALPSAALATFTLYLAGLVLGVIIGVVLGITLGWYRTLCDFLDPLLGVYNAVPGVVLFPILLVLLGLGTSSKLVLVVIMATLPVLFNMIEAMRNIDGDILRVSRAFGASDLQIFGLIALPASIPYLVGSLRQASGHALVGDVLADFFVSTGAGLGHLIVTSANAMEMDRMFASLLTLTFLALCIDYVIRLGVARTQTRGRKHKRPGRSLLDAVLRRSRGPCRA